MAQDLLNGVLCPLGSWVGALGLAWLGCLQLAWAGGRGGFGGLGSVLGLWTLGLSLGGREWEDCIGSGPWPGGACPLLGWGLLGGDRLGLGSGLLGALGLWALVGSALRPGGGVAPSWDVCAGVGGWVRDFSENTSP